MKFRRITTPLCAALFLTSVARAGNVNPAGPITGGNRLPVSNAGIAALTLIAVNAPITGSGTLDTVVFDWNHLGCGVRIKVFRLDGANIDFVGERGPITVTQNVGVGSLTSAPLSPPIPVQKGDFLGITPASADCGSPVGWSPSIGTTIVFSSDVTSTVSVASASFAANGFTLNVFASGTGDGETFAGILTGAGSLHGGAGSNIKTGLQATNPGFSTILGRIVFHPAAHSAGANDPSFGFSLEPGRAASVDDLVAAIGLSGLFSVDVYTSTGSGAPLVIGRVYNDAGALGTTGFTEELIDPSKVQGGPGVSVTGVLLGPPDISKYRYNVGIRTIGGPVGVFVSVKDHHGDVVHTSSSTYPADSYTQLSAHDFLGGFDLDPDETLVITFSGGRAIIYGATVDNITNDTSVQFMPYLFAIA